MNRRLVPGLLVLSPTKTSKAEFRIAPVITLWADLRMMLSQDRQSLFPMAPTMRSRSMSKDVRASRYVLMTKFRLTFPIRGSGCVSMIFVSLWTARTQRQVTSMRQLAFSLSILIAWMMTGVRQGYATLTKAIMKREPLNSNLNRAISYLVARVQLGVLSSFKIKWFVWANA